MNSDENLSQAALILAFPGYEREAQAFAAAAAIPCATLDVHHFPDAESKVMLPANPPDHIILCNSLEHPNEKLVDLVLAADGARNQGAKSVSLVAPYLCYMRQDKAFHRGEVVSQRVIGKLLAAYFDNVLTVDAHLHRIHQLSEAIPVRHAVNISAAGPMARFIRQHVEQPYLIGPDGESEQWVSEIATHGGMEYSVALKERFGDREVRVNLPPGGYQGRNIVFVDDVASTGETLLQAVLAVKKYQPACVSVLVTHALFVDQAIPRLRQAGVSNIWSCDSIAHPTNAVPLAATLAAAIGSLGIIPEAADHDSSH